MAAHVLNFHELTHGKPHTVARTAINPKLRELARDAGIPDLRRFKVPDNKVKWGQGFDAYHPVEIDVPRGASRMRKAGDRPHPADPRRANMAKSWELGGQLMIDPHTGRPYNPIGRTGLSGRGILDLWGVTRAADPLVTRYHPKTGKLEVLVISRGDGAGDALPGGKVDPDEETWLTAGRELGEEASVGGVKFNFSPKARRARKVYAGYIDDSRNTDNSWMESEVYHYHLENQEAADITIRAGSDAKGVHWASKSEAVRMPAHGLIVAHALAGMALRV